MDYLVSHFSPLVISVALSIWVAHNLHRNGRVFLMDAFHGDTNLADAVIRLLLIAFCLINAGYLVTTMRFFGPVSSLSEGMQMAGGQIGALLLVLGAMYMLAIFLLSRMRAPGQRAAEPEGQVPGEA